MVTSAVILVFTAILIYNHWISKQLLLKNVKENVASQASSAVQKMEVLFRSSMEPPESLAEIIKEFRPDASMIKKIQRIMLENNQPLFGTCAAFEPNAYNENVLYQASYYYKSGDSIKYENLGTKEYNYFLWDWYQIPRELKTSLWSEPYYDEGGGNIIMSTYSVPIMEADNVIGIVTIDISLEWLKQVMSELRFFESGYAFLLSRNGTIITHPRKEYIMNESIFSLAEGNNMPQLREIGRSMIEGKSGFTIYKSILTEKKGLLFFAPIPSTGWSLAIVIPQDELYADLYRLNRDLAVIGVMGIFLLILLIIFIAERITNPLCRLARTSREIGAGKFDVLLPTLKSKDEIGQLNESFKAMQKALKDYIENLRVTTAEKEKIESEVKIARDIQQGILPNIFPPFPERKDIDVFATLDPARDVGGDLYDFFFMDEDHLCFAIGDVSGKGIPASLFMAITRTLFRAKGGVFNDSEEIASEMNKELCRDNENAMFVTFFLGIIELSTGKLFYCNAGHNYPYMISANKKPSQLKETHGIPLGLFVDIDYNSSVIQMNKGDILVLYTDGVNEAFNLQEEAYGDERLEAALEVCANKDLKGMIKCLYGDIKKHTGHAEQSDDITLLVLKYY